MSDDVHPCDEALGNIHEMAISFAIQSRHDAGLILASAHQQIQQYLIGEDDRIEAARREEREACAQIADKCNTNMFIADTIAAKIRARSTTSEHPRSLLRSPDEKPPEGCYCKPGRCMAPVVMGRQQPCLDPTKASLCPHCALPQMNCDCMPARSTTGGKQAEPVGPKTLLKFICGNYICRMAGKHVGACNQKEKP